MTDDIAGIDPEHPLLLAAAIGLFAERIGRPLRPWQQRLVEIELLRAAGDELVTTFTKPHAPMSDSKRRRPAVADHIVTRLRQGNMTAVFVAAPDAADEIERLRAAGDALVAAIYNHDLREDHITTWEDARRG